MRPAPATTKERLLAAAESQPEREVRTPQVLKVGLRAYLRALLPLLIGGTYLAALAFNRECRLRIELLDAETRQPVPGVIRISPVDGGDPVRIAEWMSRAEGLKGEEARSTEPWYVLPGPGEVSLSPARLKIDAFSGLESELASRSVDLTGRSEDSISLPVRFFSRAAREKWYAANTHLHLQGLSRERADRYLLEVPRADRLDLVFISQVERAGADHVYITNEYPVGDVRQLSSSGVLVNQGEEHRNNLVGAEGYGHVMLLGIQSLIRPVSIGPGINRAGDDGTPLERGIAEAHRQGGTAIWCHNAKGLEDVPNLVLGGLDAVNVFDGSSQHKYEDSFYRYLNAGMRVPFSTGTDWFMFDLSRAYARVEGTLGVKPWLSALRAGRSFITNGPLLDFTVEAKGPGETIGLASAGEVRVQGSARGRLDFGKLELVRNGEVVAQVGARPNGGHHEAVISRRLSVSGPSWLALRVSGGGLNEYGRPIFGHTSPVYLTVAGKAIRIEQDVQYLIAEIERAIATINQHARFLSDVDRKGVLDVYRRAMVALQGPER